MGKRIHNPSNIRMNCNGEMVDKYGRKFETDWKEFDKKKTNTPALQSLKLK